jgi:hypothetical protein
MSCLEQAELAREAKMARSWAGQSCVLCKLARRSQTILQPIKEATFALQIIPPSGINENYGIPILNSDKLNHCTPWVRPRDYCSALISFFLSLSLFIHCTCSLPRVRPRDYCSTLIPPSLSLIIVHAAYLGYALEITVVLWFFTLSL